MDDRACNNHTDTRCIFKTLFGSALPYRRACRVGNRYGTVILFYFLYKKVQDKTLLYLVTMLIGSIGLFYCNTDDYFKIYGLMVGAFAAFIFESKYINFECDGVIWWKKLLRLLFGLLIVLAFKEGLKPLFDLIAKESFYLAMIRYMITGFVGLGLYPWLFKKLKFLS